MAKILKLPRRKAAQVLKDPSAMGQLIGDAQKKAQENHKKLKGLWVNIQLMIKMLKAYWQGDYRRVPYRTLLMCAAALLYFINPLDFIPDPLLFGFVDDALIIGYVLSSIQSDLHDFDESLHGPWNIKNTIPK